MRDREKCILDCFADWASVCKAEYARRFEGPADQAHIDELTQKAKNAFLDYKEFGVFDGKERCDARAEFYEHAREYFSYGLHIDDGLYEDSRDQIKRFNLRWEAIEKTIAQAVNISEAFDLLYDRFLERQTLWHVLEDGEYDKNDASELARFALNLEKRKKDEFDKKFGEKVIFELAGRYFAEKIFDNMTRTAGRKKKTFNNLDTVRAHRFGCIVDEANDKLAKEGHDLTTISEVCQLTFGEENLLASYDRSAEIEWGLQLYFKVKNSTVSAFLNSISRGKAKLRTIDF